eukprot:9503767-Pyramimonas_sp.AAC.3
MVGDWNSTTLKVKAGEMVGLFEYLLQAVEKHLHAISDKATDTDAVSLLRSGQQLKMFTDITKLKHRKLEPDQVAALKQHALAHVQLAQSANVHMVPKHHMMLHMAEEARHKGNPKFYATWTDETINRFVGNAAASCHRRTLERKSLQKTSVLLERGSAYLFEP